MRDLETIKAENLRPEIAQRRRDFHAKLAAQSKLTKNWKADSENAIDRRARYNLARFGK